MASNTNFFDILSMLEDVFEFNKNGERSNYREETIVIYRKLKNFIVGCSWTDNPHYKFIVENKSLSSEELAIKYCSETQGKQKAAATFRVQRAEVCKILSGLLGNNLNEIFFAQDEQGLKDLNNRIALLSSGTVDTVDVFPDFILDKMKKQTITDKYVRIEDCSKEIIVLSRFTLKHIQSELDALDPDKMAYIFSLLNSDIIRNVDGKYLVNKERLQLLSELNSFEKQQSKIIEMQNKINTLQHENNELRRKHKFDRQQVGVLSDENSKLKQVVELYEENDKPNGVSDNSFTESDFSDEDLEDDSFFAGGTE